MDRQDIDEARLLLPDPDEYQQLSFKLRGLLAQTWRKLLETFPGTSATDLAGEAIRCRALIAWNQRKGMTVMVAAPGSDHPDVDLVKYLGLSQPAANVDSAAPAARPSTAKLRNVGGESPAGRKGSTPRPR
jgi:hypothetical protein